MYDFKNIEEEVQALWKKNSKYLESSIQEHPDKKIFSFLEGPPTANAPPALHHVEVRTFKDLFCKYKSMQGFAVPRKGGWDCHGLPVEVQVEKALKLKSKKEVVDYGVGKFIKKCRDSVFSYIEPWEENTRKVDYQIDLKNPYRTMDNNYIESVWWSLKELYNKNLLYEGKKVVPYCPRCETPLSTHEVSQGYKDVSDPTVTVKLKLKDEKDTFILAWTTTPWTLPSNLALAVNKKITYVKVEHEGSTYILAKDLINKYFEDAKIKEEFSGKDLVGKTYEPLFNYFEKELAKTKAWTIIPADFVNTDEGTGVVHMAPAFGEDDFNACKEHDIPFVQPIDNSGKFTKEVPDFKDKFVKDADPEIIEWLKDHNKLYKTEKYLHQYPYCWRCNSPLIYFSTDSWFVKVTAIKKDMIKNNKNISWYPSHIKEGRFGNWLEEARDWALSRKKFWGTPLPVWRSEDGDEVCVGSIAELEKLSGKKITDLHKPFIDTITFEKDKKLFTRVPDVIDCWYDSGSAPFAQLHYPFENKEYFNKRHPYDFIAEAIDQTRGWFYTMHVLSTALFNKPAYTSVVCAGHLVDGKGEKMSKSKGNVLSPNEIFDTVGIDAVRLQMCATAVGDQKKFSVHLVNESVLPFLNILFNTYRFTKNTITVSNKKPSTLSIEDDWMISKTNTLIKEITEEIEKHNYHNCLRKFITFVNDDLSRWYIKIIRDRASNKDKAIPYVMNYVFGNLTKLMAPFAPYMSEYINSNLFDTKETIHTSSWPKAKESNNKLEEAMELTKEITSKILKEREVVKIGVRWPLNIAKITVPKKHHEELNKLSSIIMAQTNVKGIELKDGKEIEIKLDTKLTKELEQEGFSREVSRKVQAMRKTSQLIPSDRISLVIDSDIDLMDFKEQLMERLGAVNLAFGALDGTYDVQKEEKIKDHVFRIAFNKL